VDRAARLAAQLELGRETQLHGGIIGSPGCKFDLLKDLTPFTPRGFAVRTPVDIHSVLANESLIAA